jgi:beta-N-acetylhexosaminidase
VLAVYSYQPASTTAAAAALFGEIGTPGRLPVSLRMFTFGHGLNPVGQQQAATTLGATGGGKASHALQGAVP